MPSSVHCPYSNLFSFKQSFSLLCTRIKLEQELSLTAKSLQEQWMLRFFSDLLGGTGSRGNVSVSILVLFLLSHHRILASSDLYSDIYWTIQWYSDWFFFLFYHSVSWCNGDITQCAHLPDVPPWFMCKRGSGCPGLCQAMKSDVSHLQAMA